MVNWWKLWGLATDTPFGEFRHAPSALKRRLPSNTSKKEAAMRMLLPEQVLGFFPGTLRGVGRGTPNTLHEGRQHPLWCPKDRDFSQPKKKHAIGRSATLQQAFHTHHTRYHSFSITIAVSPHIARSARPRSRNSGEGREYTNTRRYWPPPLLAVADRMQQQGHTRPLLARPSIIDTIKSICRTAAGTLPFLPPLALAHAPSSARGCRHRAWGPSELYGSQRDQIWVVWGATTWSRLQPLSHNITPPSLHEDAAPSPSWPTSLARPQFDRVAALRVPCAEPPRHARGAVEPLPPSTPRQQSSVCVGGSREGEDVGGTVVELLSAPQGRERIRSEEFFFARLPLHCNIYYSFCLPS
jgi:hypothetical protein